MMTDPTPPEAEVIAAMTDDERALYEFSMGMRSAAAAIARDQVPVTQGEKMPTRIQLSRAKGWRLPPNTVVVSRPGRWGNPFRVGDFGIPDQAAAVQRYREWLDGRVTGPERPFLGFVKKQLRGKNLACWCKPGTPCHADVLLELANA